MYAQGNLEVKANPVGWAFGATNISLEMPLEHHKNITLNASAWHYSDRLIDALDISRKGGASVGVRRYLLNNDDQGVFMGLASRYINSNAYSYYETYDETTGYWDYGYNEVDNSYLSLGFTVGYKLVYDRITIDTFCGVGRKVYQPNPSRWELPAEFMGGINFGYRF